MSNATSIDNPRLMIQLRVEDVKGISAAACGSSHSAFVSNGRCLVHLWLDMWLDTKRLNPRADVQKTAHSSNRLTLFDHIWTFFNSMPGTI